MVIQKGCWWGGWYGAYTDAEVLVRRKAKVKLLDKTKRKGDVVGYMFTTYQKNSKCYRRVAIYCIGAPYGLMEGRSTSFEFAYIAKI